MIEVARIEHVDYCAARDYAPAAAVRRAVAGGRVLVATGPDFKPLAMLRGSWLHDVVPMLALVWVDDAVRRSGLGSALLDRWCAQMRDAGHAFVLSSSTDGEELSVRWHAACGFRRCGAITDYEDGVDELLYRLEL